MLFLIELFLVLNYNQDSKRNSTDKQMKCFLVYTSNNFDIP